MGVGGGVGEISGHVIVCGLNDLGFGIAEQVHASGVPVVVVDERARPGLRRRLERWGVPWLPENATNAEVLVEAGIAAAQAVVACHESDLVNLEIALVAAEIAPDVRVVAQFANGRLGDQLVTALPAVRVLSQSEKAGPSFVEACVRSDLLHAFRVGADVFAVVGVDVDGGGTGAARATGAACATGAARGRRDLGTVRDSYPTLTPLVLRRPGRGLDEVCPSRDAPLSAGDQLTLLGRLADFAADGVDGVDGVDAADAKRLAGLTAAVGEVVAPVRASRRASLRALLGTAAAEFDRPFRLALVAVFTIIVIGTVVLSLAYRANDPQAPADFDALDALYLTVATMATVGYGDYNFGAADPWLQAFGVTLMLGGALSVAVVYAFITNVVISRRLERTLGGRHATAARDHVIVCGLGSIGLATVEGLLSAGHAVVVIDRDEDNRFLSTARDMGVPVVIGDATVEATLLEAGIGRAATLAALTSDDVANLEAVLSAREAFAAVRANRRSRGGRRGRRGRRGPDWDRDLRVVLRVFDTALAEEVERRFDIHTARSASALATPWFVGAALGFDVVSTFYVDHNPFLVVRLTVQAGGGLDGPSLLELSTGIRMLAVSRGSPDDDGPDDEESDDGPSAYRRPGRHTRLRPGEELLAVGPPIAIIETVRRNLPPDGGRTAEAR
jgi:Trk K+ transport system NAD-binding subunit